MLYNDPSQKVDPLWQIPDPACRATESGDPGVVGPVAGFPHRPERREMHRGAVSALICLIAVVFCFGLLCGWALDSPFRTVNTFSGCTTTPMPLTTSRGSDLADLDAQREAVIMQFEPAVVEIKGPGDQGETTGSGIIIDTQGDIITNKHVIAGVTKLHVVLSNGKTELAQIVGTSATNDLAIIRIQPFSTMKVAVLANSAHLTVGERVLAIGSPLGYAGTATEGMISALNRTADETGLSGSGDMHLTGLIQTSAPLNPGNSGGALIDMQGELVGIPTLTAMDTETNTPANGISFAIPSNQVKQAFFQMISAG
jgi:S1-C subfamily serine protease